MVKQKESTTAWTSPSTGVIMAIAAVVGIFCSVRLLSAELTLLADPNASLTCDLNPLVACSDSLLAPQAHLFFGLPNAIFGAIAFGMVLALAAVLIFKGSLPRIVWIGMAIGAVAGLIYVGYFLFESVSFFGKLCPYCMGVWSATLAFLPLAIGGAGASGALGAGAEGWGRGVHRFWWAITLVLYLIVILIILVTLSDKIGYLFS